MSIRTSNFVKIATVAAVISGISVPTPVAAQNITGMPTLQFPTNDGSWGCWFTGRCTGTTPAAPEKMQDQ